MQTTENLPKQSNLGHASSYDHHPTIFHIPIILRCPKREAHTFDYSMFYLKFIILLDQLKKNTNYTNFLNEIHSSFQVWSLWPTIGLSHYINPFFIITWNTVSSLRITGPRANLGPSFAHHLSPSFYCSLLLTWMNSLSLPCLETPALSVVGVVLPLRP
jgi:hypothetical protein